ncbi:hypothetical protein [Streptomyces sp. T028]|uniref:hypothetical protein n=1 Tax=Streptomyces sp. T028 TaxID=3394379 RepID=UPI003A8AB359
MSRETDSPSSGSNGRGGAAYPSGTPPYGIPVVPDAGADAGRSAAQPEERKTETTLTTRIRINIPGSRPIPPVVVRKPVADSESDGNGTGADAQPGPAAGAKNSSGPSGSAGSDTGTFELPAEPAPAAAEEKASDWFAPRKSGPAKGGQGGGATNGAGIPGGSATGAGASGTSGASGASSAPGASAGGARPGAGRPAGGRPGGVVGSMSAPIGSRPGGTNGAGLPGATGGPVAPGHGGGTGSFDVTEALTAGPLGTSRPPQGGAEARRDDLPYFSESGRGDQQGFPGTNGRAPGSGSPHEFNAPTGGPGSRHDFNGPDGPSGPHGLGGPQGPMGPTGGPVTGDGPMVPPVAQSAAGTAVGAPGTQGTPGNPNGYGGPGRPGGPGGPRTAAPGTGTGTGPATGRLPGGGLSDDTAVLTPQKPAPEPGGMGGGFGRPADNVSGHTVTSGIPVVPSGAQGGPGAPAPFAPGGTQGGGPGARTAPKSAAASAQNASDSKKKKKKGRSKLVLLGGVLVLGGVGVYGAGLLMNHSDVPKGTTVFGVDIGGSTRDEAVAKLDDAFEKRAAQALKLSVDGDTVSLKPDQAGLQFDIQATVDDAAKSDYNPVSVIGSLFGQHREIEPELPVDEEKLQAALQSAAGGSGSATDGTIKFESGKAVAVYGKAGKGIDAAKAGEAVVAGYRTQVETGSAAAVNVPTTAKQPTITDAEVDRMMKEFAEPAMSANVKIQVKGTAQGIEFSPKNSLWKFLGVKAVDGKLVEAYDQEALKELYGGTFDGVLITRGTGQKTAVTVQDVIGALRPALKSTTDRTAVIDTNPS